MAAKSGHEAVVEQLLADGFGYIFGNPGTSEEGLLDAIERRPELKYVLALQESVAVLAADGYARATNRPTAVQIHRLRAWATRSGPFIKPTAATRL